MHNNPTIDRVQERLSYAISALSSNDRPIMGSSEENNKARAMLREGAASEIASLSQALYWLLKADKEFNNSDK